MLGTTDEEEEGIWRHIHNNKQVLYSFLLGFFLTQTKHSYNNILSIIF